MGWKPISGHVSQLQPNPNTGGLDGREDCGPACLVRYLREVGKLSPLDSVASQLNTIRELINGLPDSPNQGGTSDSDLERVSAHYGIQAHWSTDYAEAQAASFSIVLIDAPPTPAQYPASWLGGQNHWILWLPNWNGAADWFDDPLAYDNGQQDCQYPDIRGMFLGAIILPNLPDAPAQQFGYVAQACSLKVQANHGCTALAHIPGPPLGRFLYLNKPAVTTDGEVWRAISFVGKPGWIPQAKIKKT